MINLGSCFTGIGAWEKGLKDAEIEFDLKFFCEIDKFAIKSYCAIHDEDANKNIGDIASIKGNEVADIDLFVYSPPCQAFSVAGKMMGVEDKRGVLFFDSLRIIQEKQPKIAIMENVKGLITKKFKETFTSILKELEKAGYNNYWKVLNLKNYGLPQNRERVFIVSIRKDIDDGYEFPQGYDNGLRLKDMLEDEVDDKYYIGSDKVEKLLMQLDWKNKDKLCCDMTINEPKFKDIGNCIKARYDAGIVNQRAEGIGVVCPVITPDRVNKRQNGRRFKEDGEEMFTLTGQDRHGVLQVGNIVDTGNFDNPQRGRIYSDEGCCPSLNTCDGGGLEPKILQQYRIRKLTPLETWRLQGFKDEDIQKCIDAGISNSQLYKQAGNSIGVTLLVDLFNSLKKYLKDGEL
jgi:DNA (cytosine-5)-methyltransferase 1